MASKPATLLIPSNQSKLIPPAYAASDTDISIPTFLRREPTATTEPVAA